MDVQKYIKRLKFARADMDRNAGYFRNLDEAKSFLDRREFFFGDPFVVKYGEGGGKKLVLAIGKGPEPTKDEKESGVVTGEVGAYEIFDMNEFRDAIVELSGQTTANTEDIAELFELIGSVTGDTSDIKEIVGDGWTDSPDNVTITDRIKKDEQLSGIVWGHNDGEPYDGHLPNTALPYASGETIAKMIETISNTLTGVLFKDEDVVKTIKFDYNSGRNILYYTAGTENGEIKLSQAAVVDRAYYDAATEELVIEFILGENEKQEVRIPVRGLITEWVVDNEGHNVKLTRTSVVDGPDVLSADINDALAEVLANMKVSCGLAEDGHLLQGTLTGHTQDSTSLVEAINKLDAAIGVSEHNIDTLRTDIENTANTLNQKIEDEIADMEELSNVVRNINSNLADLETTVQEEHEETERAINIITENVTENTNKIESLENSVSSLDGEVENLENALNSEVVARESIEIKKFNEEECRELGDDVRAAYVLINNNVESEPIIVYKDEDQDVWIDEIYIGHSGDTLENAGDDGWSQTNRIIADSIGEQVIRFIITRKSDGWYKLGDKWGKVDFDAIEERIETIESDLENFKDVFNASEEETTRKFNELGNAISENSGSTEELYGRLEQEKNERISGDTANNAMSQMIQEQLDDEKESRKAIKLVQLNNSQIITQFGPNTNVKEAYFLTRLMPNSTQPYVDPQPGDVIVKVYKNPVYSLNLDHDLAVISLNWTDENGQERSSSINVSDFTKDSFLEDVRVVTRDGVQYIEFSFKTYDGEPVPIYIPLSDLATIYIAGDGIDKQEFEENQVITVKIDEFARKNYLAKSTNGLLITGVTEEIEEAVSSESAARESADNELRELINNEVSARTEMDNELNERITELSANTNSRFEQITEIISGVTGETLSEYIRKDEVENHLDSGSTLPVQNKVVTKALDDLMDDVQEIIESMTAITANTIEVKEITGDTAYFSGLTANTIYADEYQNLPTATTTQYGVVILEDDFKAAGKAGSTNPATSKAIYDGLVEIEKAIAAALNDQETKKANKIDVQAADQYLQEQIDSITSGGLTGVRTEGSGNVLVSARKEGNDVVVSAGTIDTSHLLETSAFTAYTASTSDEFHTEHITADTIYTTAITATTANIENLTAQTIVTEEITGNSANFTGVTANTIDVDNIAVQTILTESITGNTANFTGMTATTVSATTYNNLPTATTTNYGVVKLDETLDSGSTNPVMNSGITKVILENEETVSAALNDLNDRKANKTDVDSADENLQEQIDNINREIEDITSGGLTGVVTAGTGNVVTNIEKDGNNVKATFGTIDTSNLLETSVFNAYTANTKNEFVTSAITANTINATGITATTEVVNNFTANTEYVEHLTANTINTTAITATTVSATTYSNLPTATTVSHGVVIVDDHLDSGSTNPVENRAISQKFKDIDEEISTIVGGGLTGVVTAGTGNVVTNIEKDGNDVKATLGATMLEKSVFDTYTANTKNEFVTSAITANTEYVEHLTANTINTTAVTATTVSATTYNNLPTATTTDYGMVIIDDHLDSGSTHAVMNSGITKVILENEETVAAALNDLETRKANNTDVNNALDNHETRITNIEDVIETIEGGGITGVTTTGTGNVITGLTKNWNSVVGQLGTITADDRVLNTTFNTYTASTQTTMTGKADKSYVDANFVHEVDYTTSGTSHVIVFKNATGGTIDYINADDFIKDGMVDNVQISGSSLVITFNTDSGKSPISIPLSNIFDPNNYYSKTQVDNLLAGKSNTGHTHTAAELPTASTTNPGIVKVDDALSTGSTNPVQNKVITQTILDNKLAAETAINNLNNSKANIEDVPVRISDLSDGGDVAMKTDLSRFLPLSGGTMTGNISGNTGCSIYMPGGFFQTSDERLKIFMGDVDNALEKAKQIPTKYFYWKDRYDGPREIGTSAQRVQELFPEIVSGDDKLSVDYSKLAIVALAAVKELSAKVDELEQKIKDLIR